MHIFYKLLITLLLFSSYLFASSGGGVGSVKITNFPASQPVTFPAGSTLGVVIQGAGAATVITSIVSGTTISTYAQGVTPVSGSFAIAAGTTILTYAQGNTPVTGSFYQTTQPISIVSSGNTVATVAQGTTPVTGSFFQTTQPVSIVSTGNTVAVVVQGTTPVSLASLPSGAVTNAGTFATQVTSITSGTTIATYAQGTTSVSIAALPSGAVTNAGVFATQTTLGETTGKSLKIKNGLLNSVSSVYQEVLAYTVTSGKTFYMNLIELEGKFAGVSATASTMGNCSLQIPRGTTVATFNFENITTGQIDRVILAPSEPTFGTSTQVVVLSCIPSGTTTMIWQGTIMGYEQ